MKSKILCVGVAGISALWLAGCHSDHSSPSGSTSMTNPTPAPTPPTSSTMSLDTALALGLASQTSETATPFAVNGGAVVLTDTSETSTALSINTV